MSAVTNESEAEAATPASTREDGEKKWAWHGTREHFTTSNAIWVYIQENYEHGRLHGPVITANLDGSIVMTNWCRGYKSGARIVWYGNGQIWEYCCYVDGDKHGSYLKWHSDGTLRNQDCTYWVRSCKISKDEFDRMIRHAGVAIAASCKFPELALGFLVSAYAEVLV